MHSFTVLALFIIIYIFIAIQRFPFIKIDRPAGVFTGVTLLIIVGVITLDEGYKFVDLNVITFLMSMMIMISYLQISGFFGFAAHRIVQISKTPKTLLAGLIGSCAILSALFVNPIGNAHCAFLMQRAEDKTATLPHRRSRIFQCR